MIDILMGEGAVKREFPGKHILFKRFGIDISKEPMLVYPTLHYQNGGLEYNSRCETSIPGFFSAGEVSGGVHGPNRLGGNALAETQVFGKRAGEAAGKTKERKKSADPSQIEDLQKRLDMFLAGEMYPSSVVRSLRTAMWEGAGIFRNAPDLEKTLEIISHLRTFMMKASKTANLAECCIADNMLTTAALVVNGALLRKESRGAHVRQDIIQTWEGHNSPYGHTYQSLSREGIEMEGKG
jgi:fumarate reductase (CoM/CoB) subunit A